MIASGKLQLNDDRVRSLCMNVQKAIEGTRGQKGAVVKSHYTGPAFQHAHGLSVYFPFGAETTPPNTRTSSSRSGRGGDASSARTCA